MRVLLVHTSYRQAGGEDSVVRNQSKLLEMAGHTVATHILENPTTAREAAVDVMRAPWNPTAAESVVRASEDFGADVVHVHNTWFALSPAVFPRLKAAGHPTVATIHNYRPACVNALFYRDGKICEDCLGRGLWRGVAHACYRDSRLQSAAVAVTVGFHRRRGTWRDDIDVVVALTDFAADKLAVSGFPASKIVVVPNVVADPGPRRYPASASRSVLFVGRLTEDKGVLDLLEAWGGAATDLTLDVVGDGPLLDEVRERAGQTVRVLGRRTSDDVQAMMLRARALVLPSRWFEGLPMVLLEAMAAGLPAVVPDHGAMAEVAAGGGIVFRGGDIGGLSDALAQLESDDLVATSAEAGRRRFETEFTLAEGARRLEEVYRTAIRRSGMSEGSAT